MRIILSLFLLLSFSAQAQNYERIIAKHRDAYKDDFITNQHSPLKKSDLQYLDFYPANSNFRVTAKLTLLENQPVFKMPTYAGTTANYVRYAKLDLELNGKALQLTLYKSVALSANPVYKDYLFLPFTDQTNGKETYGGGRYLDLKTSDIADGKIELDFNKAYNPYCAYSGGYRCPIPPEENDLALEIKAGEKKYKGDKKH